MGEFWRRAGVAHSALVSAWFAAGVDVVIAHGPFFESRSYDSLFASPPAGTRVQHVLLQVSYEVAQERVSADPDRAPHALSKDPEFLRSTHDNFKVIEAELPHVDLVCDTTYRTALDAAEELARTLFQLQ